MTTELDDRVCKLLAEWWPLAAYAERQGEYPNGAAQSRRLKLERELDEAWDAHDALMENAR